MELGEHHLASKNKQPYAHKTHIILRKKIAFSLFKGLLFNLVMQYLIFGILHNHSLQ